MAAGPDHLILRFCFRIELLRIRGADFQKIGPKTYAGIFFFNHVYLNGRTPILNNLHEENYYVGDLPRDESVHDTWDVTKFKDGRAGKYFNARNQIWIGGDQIILTSLGRGANLGGKGGGAPNIFGAGSKFG